MFLKSVIVVAVVACGLHCVIGRTVVSTGDGGAEKEVAPKVEVGGGGVSASFGGYSASAGLGGLIGGSPGAAGGLYARAGTPDGTGASAGLGGAVNSGAQAQGGAHAGANVGSGHYSPTNTKNRPSNPTFYNDIFNIPTSILGAVNRLLNGATGAVRLGTSGGGVHVGGGSAGEKSPDAGIGLNVAASAQLGGHSSGAGGTGHHPQSGGIINDIFNIPITALNAVNQLLNNKGRK